MWFSARFTISTEGKVHLQNKQLKHGSHLKNHDQPEEVYITNRF